MQPNNLNYRDGRCSQTYLITEKVGWIFKNRNLNALNTLFTNVNAGREKMAWKPM